MLPTAGQLGSKRYIIESSDVLDQFRINISEVGSQNILWYKERHINEHEIVESLIDSTSKSVKWTIHKPRDGWYLRLRSPAFPPNVFISLIPPPPSVKPSELPTTNGGSAVKSEEDGSLTFVVRTSLPPQSSNHGLSATPTHSYPPPSPQTVTVQSSTASTPTAAGNQPPTLLNEVNTKLNKIITPPRNSSITRFLLSPSASSSPVSPAIASGISGFFNRTLALLSPPIKARVSFFLAPVFTSGGMFSPLLTFVEQTSVLSVATVGTLTIDKTIEQQMGVETAFWVAVSLAYLEFLFDRDSYLAAANG